MRSSSKNVIYISAFSTEFYCVYPCIALFSGNLEK